MMKVLATFDGSASAESTIPVLHTIAAMPGAELCLLSIVEPPPARMRTSRRRVPSVTVMAGSAVVVAPPDRPIAETTVQATDRVLNEARDYLKRIARGFPSGSRVATDAHIGSDPARAIIQRASAERPDVIVMATHGHKRLARALFGSTTEAVLRSGVAPVLLIHVDRGSSARD